MSIKFYKGDSAKFNETDHGGGIYFSNDTKEILTGAKQSYGKNADKSVTTEAITIAGGPLASDAVKNAFEGGVIPASTSVQEILSKLLCTEIWPDISVTSATLTTSVTAPTPVLSAGSKTGSLVEVGDTITVSAMTANSTVVGGTNQTTVSGFTYGYSADDDNEVDKVDGNIMTSIAVNRSNPTAKSSEKYSMTVTVTGLTGNQVTQPTANSAASQVVCRSFTGKAVAGKNKVSVEETGVGYTASVQAIDEVYIVSNLGNTKNHKFEGVALANLASSPNANTQEASLTGVYAIYSTGTLYGSFGAANDANAWNNQSDNYMKFSNATTPQRMKLSSSISGNSTFYGYIGFGADSTNGQETKKFVLLPAGWKISAVHIPDASVAGKWITSTNQTATRVKAEGEADAGYDFVNNSGHTSKYTKWQIKGSTAANLFKLTISKN